MLSLTLSTRLAQLAAELAAELAVHHIIAQNRKFSELFSQNLILTLP